MVELIVIIAIGFVAIMLTIIGFVVLSKHAKLVKLNSKLYKSILETNCRFSFDNSILRKTPYAIICKSKRQLENLDFDAYLMSQMKESLTYYETLFFKIEKNRNLYSEYIIEYSKIEKYSTVGEICKLKIKYSTFIKHEKRLYKICKMRAPIMTTCVACVATYTSPARRNFYSRNKEFSYEEMKGCLNESKSRSLIKSKTRINYRTAEIKTQELIELEEKLALKKQEQKEIEKKERDLRRKEDGLRKKQQQIHESEKVILQAQKKEEEIIIKTQEFLTATQDHIYSVTGEVSQEDTEWMKLKKLKSDFDNGQITFEEYDAKRKVLM